MLSNLDIDGSIIAYRKLKTADGRGKSNIDFAADAFEIISQMGDCAAIALDISSFFENLDHQKLRQAWCRVLGVTDLPIDHAAVFKAVTRYAVVDREAVYERLGLTEKQIVKGRERTVYTKSFKDMPKKICSNTDFREKICGQGGKFKSLVDVNRKPYGIPQGSPISDMLANLYLIDFDKSLNEYCKSRNGYYFRYSDDILIILPGGETEALDVCAFAKAEITKNGPKLQIKDKKTSAIEYISNSDGSQSFKLVSGNIGRNGLEYLGFRYDGREVWVRDATISKLYRKVSGSLHAECAALIRRYPKKDIPFLLSKFNFPEFFQRYGRVKEFDPHAEFDTWTFWTYARRASRRFRRVGRPIPMQLRRFKKIVKTRVAKELARRLS